ncbi:beta-propeller domain-containing protein, methanol dehydrogenase [Burkholderiales bacterium JOSHI_001]|nr:beta-propeller domain-containing protein, methanol dehydrogenase [Burkholderiales bacterium JOSHI_001]
MRATGLRWAHLLWLVLAACLLGAGARAQDLQPVPALSARVVDQTGTLTPAQSAALEARLAKFESEAGPQIVLLLVASTQPEDIAAFAQRVGETWKIGRRGVGDGLLLVVAKTDRKVWIAPAKALEGAVPDLAARQIVRDHISPAFKQGDFAGGLNAGVDLLMARIQGEHLPAPAPRGGGGGSTGLGDLDWQDLAAFLFIGVPVVGALLTGIFGRKLGSLVTAGAAGGLGWWLTTSLVVAGVAGVLALVLVGVLGIGAAGRRAARGGFGHGGPPVIFGGGGGWGGGGGGGGFSSGGGGDFGGGGAGGDW